MTFGVLNNPRTADHYKNGLIAKLAAGVATQYTASLEAIRSAPTNVSSSLPSVSETEWPTVSSDPAFAKMWATHIETKQRHFRAAAQYRKSIDELEANRCVPASRSDPWW